MPPVDRHPSARESRRPAHGFAARRPLIRLLRILCLMAACFPLTGLSARVPAAHVLVSAPKVDRQTFPVGRPPMHAKGIELGEAGLCHTQITCEVGVSGEAPQDGNAVLSSVSFSISARITIWVQEGFTPAIMEHEETHRAISEHYYAKAYAVANRLAEEAIAQRPALPGGPKGQALDRVLTELQTRLTDEFMRQVDQRSEFAQERFDAITDHGRNGITNAAAMAQALQEEAGHWKSQVPEPN